MGEDEEGETGKRNLTIPKEDLRGKNG